MIIRKLLCCTAIVLSGSVSIVACGSPTTVGGSTSHTNTSDPTQVENELRSKPSLEATQDQYRAIVQKLANQIAALTPGTTWRLDEDSWVGCEGMLGRAHAKQAYLMAVFTGPIPESVWPQALQLVGDAVGELGASDRNTVKNSPGDHDVAFSGSNGVVFQLATQKAATLTARSECRLKQADLGPV